MYASPTETLGSPDSPAARKGDKPEPLSPLLFAASTTRAPAVNTRPHQQTVLLADDDVDFRDAFAEALRADGHEVIEVGSGEAAIAVLDQAAKARRRPPDLVVLDLLMPRMSGVEVLQRLRKSAGGAQLPVLVVTGVNDPMLPVRLDVPVAFKPDMDAMLETVRRHLRQQASLAPRPAVPSDGSAS